MSISASPPGPYEVVEEERFEVGDVRDLGAPEGGEVVAGDFTPALADEGDGDLALWLAPSATSVLMPTTMSSSPVAAMACLAHSSIWKTTSRVRSTGVPEGSSISAWMKSVSMGGRKVKGMRPLAT